MICAQVYTQCHKGCARYTLGARYLYFKRNAEKFGVRVICKVRAMGLKIRYLNELYLKYNFLPDIRHCIMYCIDLFSTVLYDIVTVHDSKGFGTQNVAFRRGLRPEICLTLYCIISGKQKAA
jgi:hypothetical protein